MVKKATAAKKTAPKKAAKATPAKAAKKAAPKQVEEAVETVAAATDGVSFRQFLSDLHRLVGQYMKAVDTGLPVKGSDVDTSDTPKTREEREEELRNTNIRTLRTKLIELGYDAAAVKKADLDQIVSNLLDEEFGEDDADEDEDADAEEAEDDDEESEEEEDDSDDDEEEDEEGEDDDSEEDDDEEEEDGDEEEKELTREDLLALNLREVKRMAVDVYEVVESKDELKGLDKDSVIDLIFGDEEGEEEEGEEEEGDEEEEYYTEEELQGMKPNALRAICDEAGIKYKKADDKPTLIKKILSA